jgi:hypothetical protein
MVAIFTVISRWGLPILSGVAAAARRLCAAGSARLRGRGQGRYGTRGSGRPRTDTVHTTHITAGRTHAPYDPMD